VFRSRAPAGTPQRLGNADGDLCPMSQFVLGNVPSNCSSFLLDCGNLSRCAGLAVAVIHLLTCTRRSISQEGPRPGAVGCNVRPDINDRWTSPPHADDSLPPSDRLHFLPQGTSLVPASQTLAPRPLQTHEPATPCGKRCPRGAARCEVPPAWFLF
jgi:hypothetical protein